MNSISETIIFVESVEQLEEISEQFDINKAVIIALQPSAQAQLNRNRVKYLSSLSFLSHEEHEAINYKIDNALLLLRNDFCLEDRYGVSVTYSETFFYHLQSYLYYWLVNTAVISNAISEHSPVRVIAPISTPIKSLGLSIGVSGSFIGQIVKKLCGHAQLDVVLVGKHVEIKEKIPRGHFFRKVIFEMQLFWYKIASNNKKIIISLTDAYNIPRVVNYASCNMKNPFLVYLNTASKFFDDSFYDVLMGRFWKFFYRPICLNKLSDNVFLERYASLCEEMSRLMSEHSEDITFKGIFFGEELLEYIQNGLKRGMFELNVEVSSLYRIISIKKPSFIVSPHALGLGCALGELSKMFKIRASLLVPHGSITIQEEEWARKSWNESSRCLLDTIYNYVAIQSPFYQKYLFSCKSDNKSKHLVTGPLIYSRRSNDGSYYKDLRRTIYGRHYKDVIFIHASTPRPFGSYIPGVFETVDEYIRNINEMIEVFDGIQGVHLALRIRPKGFRGLSIDDLASLLIDSDSYSIYEEGSFEDHLLSADVLISYSSTTIEEALQNKIPVIQYANGNHYSHVPASSYDDSEKFKLSPAYYVSTAKDLFVLVNKLSLCIGYEDSCESESYSGYLIEEKHSNILTILD